MNVSEADVTQRFQAVSFNNDRGERKDDSSLEIFQTRIEEFRNKTLPVLLTYRKLGLLVEVKADMEREEVFKELINH